VRDDISGNCAGDYRDGDIDAGVDACRGVDYQCPLLRMHTAGYMTIYSNHVDESELAIQPAHQRTVCCAGGRSFTRHWFRLAANHAINRYRARRFTENRWNPGMLALVFCNPWLSEFARGRGNSIL
jgi:hypothetical protein